MKTKPYPKKTLQEIDEEFIYEGEDCEIVYDQTFTKDFFCIFNFVNFPLDSQDCYINVTATGHFGVTLIPDKKVIR